MATVEFRYDPKNTAWFTANAAMVLKAGEPAYHDTTGLFKLGDGVTALSALSFLPTVSASTPTIQQVLTAGQVATTTIETTGFIKTGGTFGEFLKADGSVDNNYYLTFSDISASTPLNYSNLTGVFSMNQSSALSDGYLSSTDWSTFNGKTTLAAVNAQNLSVFAATTSSQLAGVISDETGSGALVFGTSPTFTTSIFSPLVNGASTASGTLTLASTSNATKGIIQIGTTDLVNIGNKTTASQRLVRIGQDTAWIDLGSYTSPTSSAALYMNVSTPDTTNFTILGNASYSQFAHKSLVYIGINNAVNPARWDATTAQYTQSAATSGAVTAFTFTSPASTNQTLGTNISNFRVTGSTKQWATGTVPLQYFNHLTANTVSAVGASTFTNVYSLFVESSISGTNSTITNNYAAGFGGRVNILSDTATIMIGSQVGSTSRGAIYINQATPSTTNFALSAHQTTGSTYINGAGGVNILFNGNIQIIYADKLSTFGSGLTNFDFNFASTNGTKLGTATTQKLSFWNATPIVQPTTAVAAATVVSGTGGNVKHDDTFDGYTVEKVVGALRTIGLLA